MIYDITPPITDALEVWPSDTPPSREVLLDMKRGANLTLSTLHSTVHLGAHADGPNHYGLDEPGIEARSLEDYLGPCQVIRVEVERAGLIGPSSITEPIVAERVLIRTGTYPNPNRFNQDFAALAPELVDFLASRGVRLIGIDTPSVDPFESKSLEAHRRFLVHNMSILEGIVLEDVPAGVYELIALPLRLVGFDASPVRAVLRTLSA
ncbi:MAG: cyclase family protein [Isosphaeraceae bacterium]|nr:cyclase family protein [Isosphaeraceae bacterium]